MVAGILFRFCLYTRIGRGNGFTSCEPGLGLVLFEFNDAIKEGDGQRLFELYKLALLLNKVNGKTKYSYVRLRYLVQISALLSDKDADNLKWNRFFNKHGKKGSSLPLDLRMLNKCVISMWRGLGANINEKSAALIDRTTELVELIMDGMDKECDLKEYDGYRSLEKSKGAVEQVPKDLQIQAFRYQPGRNGHPSFRSFPSNLLQNLDYRELHSWISGLLKTWASLQEQ